MICGFGPPRVIAASCSAVGTSHGGATTIRPTLTDRSDACERAAQSSSAIAASRLGATSVRACDDDTDAIHAAWENLALNPGAIVTMLVGDFRTLDLDPAHVVLANITGGLLVAAATRLLSLTSSRGHVILSGFQTHEEHGVLGSFHGASVVDRFEEDDWLAVILRKDE